MGSETLSSACYILSDEPSIRVTGIKTLFKKKLRKLSCLLAFKTRVCAALVYWEIIADKFNRFKIQGFVRIRPLEDRLPNCAGDVNRKLFNGISKLVYYPEKWKKSVAIMIPKPGKTKRISHHIGQEVCYLVCPNCYAHERAWMCSPGTSIRVPWRPWN